MSLFDLPAGGTIVHMRPEEIPLRYLRPAGTTDDGEALLLEGDEGERFALLLDDEVRRALTAEGRGRWAAPEPGVASDGHVRVVEEGAGSTRPIGGLAPGAFERATRLGRAAPELRGVRALMGEGDIVRRGDPRHLGQPRVAAPARPDGSGLVRTARARLSAGEIQARLRAGESVSSVAAAAGAPEDWVARLDATVARERLVLVGQMLHERLERPDAGPSALNVGDSLLVNLQARGVAEEALESGWEASRGPAGTSWRVRFTYTQGGVPRRAEWSYDPRTREVRPLDEVAARLAWVAPGEHASA